MGDSENVPSRRQVPRPTHVITNERPPKRSGSEFANLAARDVTFDRR